MYQRSRVFSGGLDYLSLFCYGPGILNLACSFYGKTISKISDTNIYFKSGKILKCHKVQFAQINPLNPNDKIPILIVVAISFLWRQRQRFFRNLESFSNQFRRKHSSSRDDDIASKKPKTSYSLKNTPLLLRVGPIIYIYCNF